MIAGFIQGPTEFVRQHMILRAIRPSLPVSGELEGPTLELHNRNEGPDRE